MFSPKRAVDHHHPSPGVGPIIHHPQLPTDDRGYGLPMTHHHHVNHPSAMAAFHQGYGGMARPDGAMLRSTEMPVPPALTVASPHPLNLMPHHHQASLQQQGLLLMHNGIIYAPANVNPHLGSYPCVPTAPAGPPPPPTTIARPAVHRQEPRPDRHDPRTGSLDGPAGVVVVHHHHHDDGLMPATPTPRVFGPHAEHAPGDPPGLDDRQVSIGSHSDGEHISSPDTPDAADANRVGQNVVIARADMSPIVRYGYGIPSPHAFVPAFEPAVHAIKSMGIHHPTMTGDLLAVTGLPPAIPRAVPAVSTCRKTLAHCFENPSGTTNVYIRGLHPNTTDEMLLAYAARFGHVANSKAMIDNQTGACKGFGFACYRSLEEAHRCIRGFYTLGYEVSFARESFNARLKSFSDPSSTNLYVSNLPRSLTELELEAIFDDHKTVSSRIIRDPKGNSKGVGFAKFATRDECDRIIKQYHGQPIGQEQLPLQIRYADTPEQKRLKHETQKRREFRANEYNAVAYGPSNIYPFQPVHDDALSTAVLGARTRQLEMAWAALNNPDVSTLKSMAAMEPVTTLKAGRLAHHHLPSDPKKENELPDAYVDQNIPGDQQSPTIAYGDASAR